MTDPGLPDLPATATGSVEAPVEDVLEQAADLEPPAPVPATNAPDIDGERADADAVEQAVPVSGPAPGGSRFGDRPDEADPVDVHEQSAEVDLGDDDERR